MFVSVSFENLYIFVEMHADRTVHLIQMHYTGPNLSSFAARSMPTHHLDAWKLLSVRARFETILKEMNVRLKKLG